MRHLGKLLARLAMMGVSGGANPAPAPKQPGTITDAPIYFRTGKCMFSGKCYAPQPKHANASDRIKDRRSHKKALRRLTSKRRERA